MEKCVMDMSFGEIIKHRRRAKGWTVREFLAKLGENMSPSYITRIEIRGEIPSPELTCRMAEVLDVDLKTLLGYAKTDKIKSLINVVDKKYEQAETYFRIQAKGLTK
jgi:transcriptional regulator with XRE-family HTH domain